MRTKIVQVKPMHSVEDVRSCAAALVRREEYRVCSRMLAYENIGSMVGVSGMWLRRFIKKYADSTPSWPVGCNIVALYGQLCGLIETDADRRNNNAAASSNSEMDQGLAERAPGEE